MAGATLCFVAMQSMIRHVGQELPPFEVAFFRNLFGVVALAPLFMRVGLAPLRTRRFGLHATRGVIQTFGMLSFFTGVTMIPLPEVTALSFSAPLFATVLAIAFLGEAVKTRRIMALVLGFIGVLVVLRPGFHEINLGAWLILASSMFWGSAIAIIKILSRTESTTTLTLYMYVFLTPLTFVASLFVWQWPTLEQLAWLLAIGIFGTLGHLAFAQSFRKAEATAVLPLDFLRLIWASIAGYFAFGDVPDAWSWIGGAVIFGSATYIAFREARLARQGRS